MKFHVRILIFVILFSLNSTVAQSNSVDHWETVIYASDTWRYFIGQSEPDTSWRSLSYNDDSWPQGKGGIGYGDNDDSTEIDPCISVYLRIKFDIVDISKITSAVLHVDYDDAFIAYVNNIEVARAGISGLHPLYSQLAESNHEAQMPSGNPPQAFIIDSDMLKATVNQGENILALQVHNVSNTSTDLSSTTFLSLGISDTSNYYRTTPIWFYMPFVFFSSNIPIMIIDTEGRTIVDEPKTTARMGIINNGIGNRNSINDPYNEYDGWIGIEYRGNASLDISEKKPYTFETRNEDGSNCNVELLDLPSENDFILRAAYIDKTLMRDAFAYYFSRTIGRWAPRTRHIELVLNGNYEGVYILVEKIKPDKNRLNITKMDSTDNKGEAVTGGYIWSVQQSDYNDVVFDPNEADGNKRVLKYPKPAELTSEQLDYISQFEQDFCDIMDGAEYNDPVIGYKSYIDIPSFIDEIIIQELTSNSDAFSWSSFFHKDRNGKIHAGPVWDFDQALSNSTYNDGSRYDEFIIEKSDSYRPLFWDKLFKDSEIQDQLKSKWNTFRKGSLQIEHLFTFIDSVADYLSEAQEHNFSRWPILGVPVWRSLPGAANRDTYEKEVNYMKEWLEAHLSWMDEQLEGETTGVVDSKISFNTIQSCLLKQNYPNPFNPTTKISYSVGAIHESPVHVDLSIYNILGQKVATLVNKKQMAGYYSVEWNASDFTSGIYIYQLKTDNGFHDFKKLILLK